MVAKIVKQPAPAGLEKARPGEAVFENTTGAVIFIGDPRLNDANPLTNMAWIADPGIPTILGLYLFRDPRRDGAHFLKTGELKAIDTDYGVLAKSVNISDSTARAIARDGRVPEPPMQQLLDNLRGKYLECTDRSVAESVYRLMHELAWPEDDAVDVVVTEYRSAFERKDGSVRRLSWAQLADTIIRNAKEKEGVS